ncbi:trans-resveratrol di-O-methyltransferase-like [Panicum miliaceum]|uniref:Trans-resveratrol di-O-methyltransferase-like n=1 Tax=Panicum miliaceum TaxID=4540 RepID=A0A3L6QPI8_PANMI|nr:trans-resveratrol di-O-methyltransferase-like [Panicum miliaceum]
MTSTGAGELLQAEAELWCHAFGYLKSMALQCAIKLGIPNAIHRCGGAASLPELHAALPVAASKRPCLSRIMTFLSASGIFGVETPEDGEVTGVRYHLTAASRLLVEDESGSGGHACLSQLVLLIMTPIHFRASQSLADWLKDEDDAAAAETPFMAAHGASFYGFASRDAEFGACFNEAMGSDSRFVAETMVRECGPVFAGLTSLVDAGGGDGTTARAITRAFPHVRCSVLELPHVVDAAPADGTVEFVAGDMLEFIPPADAVLLKVGSLNNARLIDI